MTARKKSVSSALDCAEPRENRAVAHMNRRDFLKLATRLPVAPLLHEVRGRDVGQNQDKPKVIVILFDTLSARHLSLHGYRRATTPDLARFASRAVV